jgi:hypothetical protein
MASRRAALGPIIEKEMAERDIDPQTAHKGTTEGLQEAHKRPTMEAIRLRLLAADLAALDALAAVEGSTRSALIRRAVKELIRRGGK